MFKLLHSAIFEQPVKKSRFLANAVPVEDEGQARAAILAHAHADASHNCWAWRLGTVYRFSDDGEPGGTAGKPILAAIDGQGIDGVAVIVSRWFGGILLGSGGLMRAYGGTAAACLRAAERVEVKPTLAGRVRVEFADLARVRARLAAVPDISIAEEVFTATGAEIVVRMPESETRAVARLVADLTSGRSTLALVD